MPDLAPKIFISYAWKNQATAKHLQSDLKRDGVEVFVDYEKITGGDSLPERISAALDWCNTLVLLWSADSAESYYVKQEWTSAFHLQKKIITCVLDGKKLPALLSGNLYLNFSPYETGYAQLCRSLGVEPKPPAEKTAPPEMPISKLPPQHAEMPVSQPPDEKRDSPPPKPPKRKSFTETFRRKPKPPDPAPVLKPPEIFDDTKHDDTNATEMATPARWSRRKIISVALALSIVAALVIWLKPCSKNSQSVLTPALPDSSYIEIVSYISGQVFINDQSFGFVESGGQKTYKLPTGEKKIKLNGPIGIVTQTRRLVKAETLKVVFSWRFRDQSRNLPLDSVGVMLKRNDFYCGKYSWSKEFSNPQGRGFANYFEKSQDGKTVFDRASGLTWQQGGSSNYMTYADAEKYVDSLNVKNFAGHSDWRLPTLEEAMSLMEREENRAGLYINPMFDKTQTWIWTADKADSAGVAWVVYFNLGVCYPYPVPGYGFVRVVR